MRFGVEGWGFRVWGLGWGLGFEVCCLPEVREVCEVAKLDGERSHLQEAQFKNNCLAKMWSGSEKGSYFRLID